MDLVVFIIIQESAGVKGERHGAGDVRKAGKNLPRVHAYIRAYKEILTEISQKTMAREAFPFAMHLTAYPLRAIIEGDFRGLRPLRVPRKEEL